MTHDLNNLAQREMDKAREMSRENDRMAEEWRGTLYRDKLRRQRSLLAKAHTYATRRRTWLEKIASVFAAP